MDRQQDRSTDFLSSFNTKAPSIKFEKEISVEKIPFPDTQIYL